MAFDNRLTEVLGIALCHFQTEGQDMVLALLRGPLK
jgi:hypothetical protein